MLPIGNPQASTANPEWPGYDAWRKAVAASLRGGNLADLRSTTADRIPIEPLYPPRSDRPALPGRGARPWTFIQRLDHPDPDEANRQALADLAGGATGLSLVLAGAPSAGRYGLPLERETLEIAFANVPLDAITIRIEPHLRGRATLDWFGAYAESRGYDPAILRVEYGLDGLGSFVRWGVYPVELSALHAHIAATASAVVNRGFAAPFVECDGRPYHEAGATEAQELAVLLATAVFYLRAVVAGDSALADMAGGLGFTLAIDQDQFVGIAKIRALRLLWARLQEVSGAQASAIRIHAETSRRMMMPADPHTNLIRTTIAAFSAAVGGADAIAILPHTIALGLPDATARQHARNVHHLLAEESQLFRTDDPGAGSGFVEALTEALCERAWSEFQRIEAEGGMWRSLVEGRIQARIGEAGAALKKRVASGASPLVGATIYLAGRPGEPAPVPAPILHPPFGAAVRCIPLEPLTLDPAVEPR